MRNPPVRLRALGAVGCVAALAALAACSSGGSGGSSGSNSNSGTITVAVVSNPLITGQMIPLTTSTFEKQNPGIKVKFATYTEGDLRAAIEKNVSTHSNAFNVIMIGPYEAPLFAKNGWLTNLSKQYIASDPGYDAGDLLPPIAKALSYKGDLYAAPFYGESSMMFYNKTLFKAAGLTMPAQSDLGRRSRASRPSSTSRARWQGSACAAWPGGATTWRRWTPWSTRSAASGST